MNITLIRTEKNEHGIFGRIVAESGKFNCVTLEHAYEDAGSLPFAKIPAGTYVCHRHSPNRLLYETFEVMNVRGHSGILIHVGNYNEDSIGCILVGRRIMPRPGGQGNMITSSKNTFNAFMDLQKGINNFTLTVKD